MFSVASVAAFGKFIAVIDPDEVFVVYVASVEAACFAVFSGDFHGVISLVVLLYLT